MVDVWVRYSFDSYLILLHQNITSTSTSSKGSPIMYSVI